MYVTFLFGVQMSRVLRDLPIVGADGAEFASFAIFSWSSLIHSRLLAMGADWVNFTWFTGTVGEMHEIWAIHSNFVEFSADGQESESIELM